MLAHHRPFSKIVAPARLPPCGKDRTLLPRCCPRCHVAVKGARTAVGNYMRVSLQNPANPRKQAPVQPAAHFRFGVSPNLLYCFYSLEREEMPETAGNQTSKMRT